MKRILSVLLALVMVIGMLPMSILSASAAEVSETLSVIANTGVLASDSSSISWTSNNVTFTNAKAASTSAIRTSDSDHFRAYANSAISISAPGNITKIVVTCTSSTYASNLTASVGAEATASGSTVTIVPTASATEYSVAKITAQVRLKTVAVTYATVDSGECAHTNVETIAAVAATCTTAGNTEGTKCADCGITLSGNETIAALGHSNDEGVVTAPTCTEDGYTLYTCTVCGSTKKDNWVDATGHNYVDGVCSACGIAKPAGLDGKYYIAAIRSSGNYWYMTNDVGTIEGKPRYQIVDSGVTTLPEVIDTPVDTQVFELITVEGGYKIKTGDLYLGWISDNYGVLVAEADAKIVTIEYGTDEGTYVIHFAASETEERYLSLNNNATNAYYAWYTGGQVQNLALVPVHDKSEGCAHEDTSAIDAKKPTCTEAGYTAGVYCNNCESIIEGCEEVEATGHNYVDGACSVCGEAEPTIPTEGAIDFASTDQRVSWDANSQIWTDGTLTVTNNKSASTSDIIDSKNPVRFYKNSDVVIEFPGMTKIVMVCNNTTYATALVNSVTGATVTADGTTVTIELAAAADSFTITLSGGQVRVNSMTVSASKICNHVWGEPVQTVAPSCAVEGEQEFTCTLCGETKKEAVASLGHVAVDGFCSVCGGEFYTLSSSLNEGDSVVIYNPENKVAMGVNTNYYNDKLLGVATDDATGLAVTEGMAVMQVKYINETDFYLMNNGKYLTTGSTGNSLTFAETADDYSKWYLEVPFEGEDVVLITNRNAVYNSKAQSIEYYNSAFTTYSRSTGKAYQMKLYTKAAPAEPVAKIEDVEYTSFADAYAAATEGQIIKLLDGITVDAGSALDKNVVIDLNGNTLDVSNETITGAVVVKDNATASFADGETGTLNDNGEIKVAAAEGYLAIYDDIEEYYTFHAYQVKLTHVSLDPTNDALGYKAQLLGDSKVQAAVTSYGFNMGVAGGVMKTFTKNAENFDGIFSLRLQNIMAANGGEMDIQAEAFVNFANVTDPVKSNSHSTTMRETLEYVNNNLSKFDAVQIVAIQGMITEFESKMTGWNIDSIKAWTATEA